MAYVKKLIFESKDLGTDIDLLFTFDDQPIDGAYTKYNPSAFAVRKFGADQTCRAEIVYRSQLAFTKVVISNNVIQSTSAQVPINGGHSTGLTLEDVVYSFSNPKSNPLVAKKHIQCANHVSHKEDIGVGFIGKEGEAAKTALVWRGVGHGQRVNAEFTPILRGYIGTDYKENGLIMGQIDTDRLFEQNLAALANETTWIITYDHATGAFSIDQK